MKEMKVTPIRNGTVIDHIPAGSALKVLMVLGLPRQGSSSSVTVAMRHRQRFVVRAQRSYRDGRFDGRVRIVVQQLDVVVLELVDRTPFGVQSKRR
jgi:hypothetical protein